MSVKRTPSDNQSPKLEEGDFYFNDSGLMVFTRQYHLKRGYCCGSKCKHCPYDWENVPERLK